MVQGYVLKRFPEGKTTILWSTANDNKIKKNGETINIKVADHTYTNNTFKVYCKICINT